jgi:hypothetical protein
MITFCISSDHTCTTLITVSCHLEHTIKFENLGRLFNDFKCYYKICTNPAQVLRQQESSGHESTVFATRQVLNNVLQFYFNTSVSCVF